MLTKGLRGDVSIVGRRPPLRWVVVGSNLSRSSSCSRISLELRRLHHRLRIILRLRFGQKSWRAGVNFTNILHEAFLCDSFAWSFFVQVSSLFEVDTFRHFGPRILNLQICKKFIFDCKIIILKHVFQCE